MADEHGAKHRDKSSGLVRSLGPALIVAAVVLGPGSILTASKVGCEYGYAMLWVLAAAALLMAGITATAATLGQALRQSLCSELAERLGRPAAAAVGVTLFLIVACFQSSNNLAVLAGLEPIVGKASIAVSAAILTLINGAIIAVLFAFRDLYRSVEFLMKALVGVMAFGFAVNLIYASPSPVKVATGFVPRIPDGIGGAFFPQRVDGNVVDPWLAVQAMVATTFSIAGACYQAYLVREKGWSAAELKKGITDSVVGIAAFGMASSMILITSATVLHGRVDPADLKSAADVSAQLEPLFGRFASMLFSVGILAGAFSSFLINAMIGGTFLSDGFGFGASIDSRGTKLATALALIVGFAFAVAMSSGTVNKVDVIIFAQALTVLGGPILAVAILYLSRQLEPPQRPIWMTATTVAATLVALVLALRTGWKIVLTVA